VLSLLRENLGCAKSCSVDHGKKLIGRDGISKTILWKKYVPSWNFAHAETFPVGHAGANRELGLFRS
jgi:hypothetical protein